LKSKYANSFGHPVSGEQEKYREFLGEKYNYPIALEAALKLKETAYAHAEGFATGEFRHGPLAIVEKGFPVICLSPRDSVYDENIKVIKEVKKAGARVIAVTTLGFKRLDSVADDIIRIPAALEMFVPVFSVIPLQILAYEMALAKGLKVDKPRNLSKFVN